MDRLWIVGLSVAVLAAGCSGGSEGPACKDGDKCAGPDASASRDSGSPSEDGAAADGGPTRDAAAKEASIGEPLKAEVSVQGQDRACGTCAIVTVNVQGGEPPYFAEWSEPSFSGLGPFEVCDDIEGDFSVVVTDSGSEDAEFGTLQAVEAHTTLRCDDKPPKSNAGLQGCIVLGGGYIFSFIDPPPQEQLDRQRGCRELDEGAGQTFEELQEELEEGELLEASYFIVPGGFKQGESYQLNFELLGGLQLDGDVRTELWGSNAGCSLEESFGELSVAPEDLGRETVCFTPSQDFDFLAIRASDDTVQPEFAFTLGVSIGLCSGCDAP